MFKEIYIHVMINVINTVIVITILLVRTVIRVSAITRASAHTLITHIEVIGFIYMHQCMHIHPSSDFLYNLF